MLDAVSCMLNVIFLHLLKPKCLKGKEKKMKAETIILMLIKGNIVEGSIYLIQNFSEVIFLLAHTLGIKY